MACSFVGLAQVNSDVPSSNNVNNEEPPEANTDDPTGKAETATQIEKTPIPTIEPTIDPLSAAKSCVAKTWEINGLSDYVIAAIPPDLASEYDLQYKDTSGEAYFTLTPDGKIMLHADNLELLLTARVSVFEVPVTVRVDGTAAGNYAIDSTTLITSNVDTSQLTASAQALGEDLIDPAQITKTIPFLSPPFNVAKYSCQGDILELELSGYSGNIPPLIFQAVK